MKMLNLRKLSYYFFPIAAILTASCGTESPTSNSSSGAQSDYFRSNTNIDASTDEENQAADLEESRCKKLYEITDLVFQTKEALQLHLLALGLGKKKAPIPSELKALERPGSDDADLIATSACFSAAKLQCSLRHSNCDLSLTNDLVRRMGEVNSLCIYDQAILRLLNTNLNKTLAYQTKLSKNRLLKKHPDMMISLTKITDLLLMIEEKTCTLDSLLTCTPPAASCADRTPRR